MWQVRREDTLEVVTDNHFTKIAAINALFEHLWMGQIVGRIHLSTNGVKVGYTMYSVEDIWYAVYFVSDGVKMMFHNRFDTEDAANEVVENLGTLYGDTLNAQVFRQIRSGMLWLDVL